MQLLVYTCTEVWLTMAVVLNRSSSYWVRQSLSVELLLANWAEPASQLALETAVSSF